MIKLSVSLLLPCLFLLSQCQGNWDSPSTAPNLSGTWYSKGDTISFVWNSGRNKHDSESIVCLLEQDGRTLYKEEINSNGFISLPIPDEARSGLLNVICQSSLYKGDSPIYSVYYFDEVPGPLSLFYYPPVPMAGSIVEVSSSAENLSQGTWLRWYLEDRLVGEGYVKDGGARVTFFGPGKKGNYTFTMELFPHEPLSHDEVSPLSESIEIFFNDIVDLDGTLQPENWQSLFYCDGSNIDRGRPFIGRRGERALGFLASNNLTPQVIEGDRGYGFNSESYLRYDGRILQGKGSSLALFQTRMIIYVPSESAEEESTLQIFNSTDGRGNNSFSLFLKEGELLFSLGQNDKFVRSRIKFPPALEGQPFWLSLVLEQENEDLLVRWYLNGLLQKEDRIESYILPQSYIGGGSTTWGKGNYPSFEGVLLEWGFNGEPEEIRKFEKDINHEAS